MPGPGGAERILCLRGLIWFPNFHLGTRSLLKLNFLPLFFIRGIASRSWSGGRCLLPLGGSGRCLELAVGYSAWSAALGTFLCETRDGVLVLDRKRNGISGEMGFPNGNLGTSGFGNQWNRNLGTIGNGFSVSHFHQRRADSAPTGIS